MNDQAQLAEHFDRSRGHLRGVAFRMLGSADEADDAVQETWLRACRADSGSVDNLTAWLTTITGRVCLDMLRSRSRRREDFADLTELDMLAPHEETADPADEAVLADSVGLALLVVLDTLGPAERAAFVLHDLFAVPFDEIAVIVERSPAAAKKLASRARRRVHDTADVPSSDLVRQRVVVDAFLAASRAGDIDALLAVLAPDVVRRADAVALRGQARAQAEVRGARAVAEETRTNIRRARFASPALVNGAVGAVVAPYGRLQLVLEFAFSGDRIASVDVIGDPVRLKEVRLGLADNPAVAASSVRRQLSAQSA
ncbi:sigma-70 family RNA polymerase sigma factor [Microbispora triticiradicis]|uniref:Sigma-70 family RNA polymerase sigma factor n=1 Tax=Microbispora triticiradicis TaxID=2200763 RepID=A0ABX9L9W5_9ACTN|nr:sigma-70 family RNA polymerase sigma factor [Microbispora triticiradicis]RGA00741.1 sigma-70 family RNA polymerase sigma factor [Microbispora triticiradicis]GLW21343.1 DNA-directed RNA polymerase sigma-70 factor [Microbispora amethystogenes]